MLELDLPTDNVLALESAQDGAAYIVRHRSHIYTFTHQKGKWSDLDLNAVLDGRGPVENGGSRRTASGVDPE